MGRLKNENGAVALFRQFPLRPPAENRLKVSPNSDLHAIEQ